MRWLVFTNLYVAICGAALTAATYVLLGQPARFDSVAGLVFCCTLAIYNLDRLVEPNPGDSEHERWVRQYRKPLWVLTWLAALSVIAFGIQLRLITLLSIIPPAMVALGYCLPVLRYGGRWHRLKAVPGAKLILIAGVWTYATAGLPMLQANAELDGPNLSILFSRLLFLAAIALPFDLPDMQRDRLSGIVTLPTRFGVTTTRTTAIAMISIAGVGTMFHPWPAGLGVLISCFAGLGLILGLHPARGVVYFMVLLDGTLLIQSLAIWIIVS